MTEDEKIVAEMQTLVSALNVHLKEMHVRGLSTTVYPSMDARDIDNPTPQHEVGIRVVRPINLPRSRP